MPFNLLLSLRHVYVQNLACSPPPKKPNKSTQMPHITVVFARMTSCDKGVGLQNHTFHRHIQHQAGLHLDACLMNRWYRKKSTPIPFWVINTRKSDTFQSSCPDRSKSKSSPAGQTHTHTHKHTQMCTHACTHTHTHASCTTGNASKQEESENMG